MWSIDNQSSYAADRTWIRDVSGRHHWVVAVRASFDMNPDGQLRLAAEQAPVLHLPEHFGDPASSSVRFDADLSAAKPSTDVLVHAHAHAPDGRPVTQVPVALQIGALRKVLVVHGERQFRRAGAAWGMTAAEPFISRPIRYESAYGGDPRNPVGRGVGRGLEGTLAPSVVYPDGDMSKQGPAGFGPLASHWSPRRELWGTYDDQWRATQRPLLARDYDARALLSAPADQRIAAHLCGGEQIELVHMSASGVLSIEVPRVGLVFETWFGGRCQRHAGSLATVMIEPEERTVYLTWQTSIEVGPANVECLDRTTVAEVG